MSLFDSDEESVHSDIKMNFSDAEEKSVHSNSKMTLSDVEDECFQNVRGCPYFILKLKFLEENSTVISRRYKRLARELHPDKNPNIDDTLFKRVNAANSIVGDKDNKKLYDSWMKKEDVYYKYSHLAWSQKLGDSTQENELTTEQQQAELHRQNETEARRRAEAEQHLTDLREAELERQSQAKKDEELFREGEVRREATLSGISGDDIFDGYVKAYTWLLSRRDFKEVLRETESEKVFKDFESFFEEVYPEKSKREYLTCDNVVAKMVFDEISYREFHLKMTKNSDESNYSKEAITMPNVDIDSMYMEHIFTLFMKEEQSCHVLNEHTMSQWRTKNLNYLPTIVEDYSQTHWDKYTRMCHEDSKGNRLGSDENFIRLLCDRKDKIFIMPIFDRENGVEHFTVVVRRWFRDKLHFFFADSWDEADMTDVEFYKTTPRNVQIFLMNSPLWKKGQTAYWSRIPNPKQVEFECGYRSVLHGILLAMGDNPFQILSSQKKFIHEKGQKRMLDKYLNVLVRQWVHDCIKRDCFIYPPFYREILKDCPSFSSFQDQFVDWLNIFCEPIESNEVHLVSFCLNLWEQKLENNTTFRTDVENTAAKRGKATISHDRPSTPNNKRKEKARTKRGKAVRVPKSKGSNSRKSSSHKSNKKKFAKSSSGKKTEEDESIQSSEKNLEIEINMETTTAKVSSPKVGLGTESTDPDPTKSPYHAKDDKKQPDVTKQNVETIIVEDVDSDSSSAVSDIIRTDEKWKGFPIFDCQVPPNVVHIWRNEWGQLKPPKLKKSSPCKCNPKPGDVVCCFSANCERFGNQEECDSDCPGKDLCTNNKLKRGVAQMAQVFDTESDKGLGLRAFYDISSCEFIMEYSGEVINQEEYEKRLELYKEKRAMYLFRLDKDFYIDATYKGSLARYMNHSCSPNCIVEHWHSAGEIRLAIFSRRFIAKGDEFTLDYRWDVSQSCVPTECICSAKNCRGTLEKFTKKDVAQKLYTIYTISVPICDDGILLRLGNLNGQNQYLHRPGFSTYFSGYRKLPDGGMSPAEKHNLFHSTGDVILAVNNKSVRALNFEEVVNLIKHHASAVKGHSNSQITFRVLENRENVNNYLTGSHEGGKEVVSQSPDITENQEEESVSQSPSIASTSSRSPRKPKVSPQVPRTDLTFLKKNYKPSDFFEYQCRIISKCKTLIANQWIGIGIDKQVILSRDWIMFFYGADFCDRLMSEPNRAMKPTERDFNWKLYKPFVSCKYVSNGNYYLGFSGASDSDRITPSWIKSTYSPGFLNILHENVNRKVPVNVGNAKRKVETVKTGLFPIVMFRQSGLHTCVVSSLASGFVHFKDNKAANALMKKKNESLLHNDVFLLVSGILTDKKLNYHVKKFKTKSDFDVLTNISCFPTIVQLIGSDGTVNHAVTVVGLFIFDSNSSEARILSQSSLDHCCGIDGAKSIYRGFHFAQRYLHTNPRKEWNLCNNCRENKPYCQYGIMRREVKK